MADDFTRRLAVRLAGKGMKKALVRDSRIDVAGGTG